MLGNCIFVGLGGMAGAVSRYLLTLIPVREHGGFPVMTLCINVMGAFFIGLLAAAAEKEAGISPNGLLLLKVGFCGGFTTFSTFSLETVLLLQNGKYVMGISYIILSVLLCTLAVILAGSWIR